MDGVSLTRQLREILGSNAGAGRTIPSSRFSGELNPSTTDGEQSRRALVKPVFDVSLDGLARDDGADGFSHSAIYRLGVTVRVIRFLGAEHALTDATRDNVAALAAVDADMIAQAFSFDGSSQTWQVDGSPTGIVGGKLEVTRSAHEVTLAADQPSKITTLHKLTGWVRVALAAPAFYLWDPVTESTATVYNSPDTGSVMIGSNTMTWGIVFYQERVTPANYGSVVTIMRGSLVAGVGNRHGVFTNNGAFYFRIYDGTGTLYGSATPTLGTAYDGTMVSLVWTYNSPTLRTYVNGVQYGSDVTTGGGITTVPDGVYGGGTKCLSINSDGIFGGGANKNDSLWYMGAALSNTTAMTSTQVAAWHSATMRSGRVARFSGVQYLLDMSQNTGLGATWTDDVGGVAFSKYGTSGVVQTPSTLRWL